MNDKELDNISPITYSRIIRLARGAGAHI